jgi:hypothetical protein
MNMKNKSDSRARSKRQLNVIYFVDSARTRSFRIPLSRLNALVAFILALVVWMVASAFILFAMVDDRQELSIRFSESLAAIFKYETRYDAAYEVAYPKGSRPVSIAATPATQKKKPIEAETKTATQKKKERKEQVNSKKAVTTKKKIAIMGLTSNSVVVDALVDVTEPVVSVKGGILKLVFKIINKNGPKKINGFVHAVAEFQHSSGKIEYFGAPSGIAVNKSGIAKHPKFAYRFSIRRFKEKKFNFKLPANLKGDFKSMKIEVSNTEGTVMGLFKVPIKLSMK